MNHNIPLTILAGGQSRRMGAPDKCLMALGDKTILEHILDVMEPQASAIMINSNSAPELFGRFGFPVRADALAGRLGPLSGLLTAMRWARETGASHVATVPADTPFLPHDLIGTLISAKGAGEIVVASDTTRLQPTIGLWPVSLADRLEGDLLAGARKMGAWLEGFSISQAEWPLADRSFFNINSKADLREAQAISRTAGFAPAAPCVARLLLQ